MLKKNIFAQLFPYQPELGDEMPVGGDVDREAPTGPEKAFFKMPDAAYTAPLPQGLPARENLPVEVPEPRSATEQGTGLGNPDVTTEEETPPLLYDQLDARLQAKRDIRKYEDRLANPQNRDKGIKGALLEGIQNFLYGMGETYRQNPRANWKAVLAGGGASAGGGAINRTWNERREDAEGLSSAQRKYQMATSIANDESRLQNEETRRQASILEGKAKILSEMTGQQKAQFDRLDKERQDVLKVWADMDEFDPNAPQAAEFVQRAAQLGVTLMPKTKGEKFNFQIAPDGRVIIGNTKTGDYKVGQDTFQRPATLSDNDIPDSLFPSLKTDDQIKTEVQASVGKLPESRRVRQNVLNALLQEADDAGNARYKNADGSFNESKYWQDVNSGYAQVSPSQLYENLPSDFEQRSAAQIKRLAQQNAPIRAAVDQFKLAIAKQNPPANAPTVKFLQVKDDFNKLLTLPSKTRAKALERFFKEILPNIKVTQ